MQSAGFARVRFTACWFVDEEIQDFDCSTGTNLLRGRANRELINSRTELSEDSGSNSLTWHGLSGARGWNCGACGRILRGASGERAKNVVRDSSRWTTCVVASRQTPGAGSSRLTATVRPAFIEQTARRDRANRSGWQCRHREIHGMCKTATLRTDVRLRSRVL